MNSFSVTDWQENALYPIEGDKKVTKVDAAFDYKGQLCGISQVTYLITYNPVQGSTFVGTEHFTGTLDGTDGQWVFEHRGTFADGQLKGQFDIVAGTSDDAVGKSGSYQAPLGQDVVYSFD